jgi:hypothetical protein
VSVASCRAIRHCRCKVAKHGSAVDDRRILLGSGSCNRVYAKRWGARKVRRCHTSAMSDTGLALSRIAPNGARSFHA